MNLISICGPYDALKNHLKTEENSNDDNSKKEREISSMISTLRQGGRVDIKTKFLNFTKISSESAGSNLQTVVSNKLNRRQPIKGQMKFRMNGIEIELGKGKSFFLNLGEISGCVIDGGTNLFALCLYDYEDEYQDDLLVMFAKTTVLSRVAMKLTRHLLTTRDEKLQEVTSPRRNNLPNIDRKWRRIVRELKPKENWFVGQLADCADQFYRKPAEINRDSIMAFDEITVDERQGLGLDLIGIPAIIKCARQRYELKKLFF